jgi:hypothetical protein
MFIIKFNDIETPTQYGTREDAIRELESMFGDIELDEMNIAFWPSISARGYTKIEVKEQ